MRLGILVSPRKMPEQQLAGAGHFGHGSRLGGGGVEFFPGVSFALVAESGLVVE